ncbi:Uncharacterised protein [Legionella beliardensis]|uniref:Putative adhesin Stv domain-containing protein n=1 Tax=Legionella beliardensis TaxID=91822 RepID=A0A378HZY7_9GAMM|nr:hypothetical protein [Legionella beliardensis]STX27955.1 Uncharacterised protein [Legionella beliardensis]
MKRKGSELQANFNKKARKSEILLFGHAGWNKEDGYVTVPENTYLYMYAPDGSMLTSSIPKALASGEKIEKGDLTIKRLDPITLFNHGFADVGEYAGDYNSRDEEMKGYPLLYGPGDQIKNYKMCSSDEKITTSNNCSIVIQNIDTLTNLKNLLEKHKGNTCHFGGCSWIREEDNLKRNAVQFKDQHRENKYKKTLTEEEKKARRSERFGNSGSM